MFKHIVVKKLFHKKKFIEICPTTYYFLFFKMFKKGEICL